MTEDGITNRTLDGSIEGTYFITDDMKVDCKYHLNEVIETELITKVLLVNE